MENKFNMNKTLVFSTLFFILLVFVGCSEEEKIDESQLSETALIAKEFLEEEGYDVLSYENSLEPYILTKEKIQKTQFSRIWQHQTVDVKDFMNKEIKGEVFHIKGHPLDDFELVSNYDTVKSLGKTNVHVMVVDNEVVGGTSTPVTENFLYGAPYSLEGKSFEEMFPGEDWGEWSDKWFDEILN